MAALSRPQLPFYQPEAAKWPDLWIWVADGRFHIVPCKQFISGQAKLFLGKAGKANGRFSKAGQPPWPWLGKRMAALSRPASRNGHCLRADGRFTKAGKPQWPFYQQWPLYQGRPIQWLVESQWPFYQARWPFYQGVIKEVAVTLGHLSTGFRVIECRASLSLARHDSGSMRAPASPAGAMRVASPRSPRVCSAPSASEAARRSARRPLTVVRASLCLGFRV